MYSADFLLRTRGGHALLAATAALLGLLALAVSPLGAVAPAAGAQCAHAAAVASNLDGPDLVAPT
jgi:hypothetical protein